MHNEIYIRLGEAGNARQEKNAQIGIDDSGHQRAGATPRRRLEFMDAPSSETFFSPAKYLIPIKSLDVINFEKLPARNDLYRCYSIRRTTCYIFQTIRDFFLPAASLRP